MIAIREIVSRDVFKNFEVPKEFGDEFEMILVPINNIVEENIKEDKIFMQHQEENGFSKNVLAQESEDVWNDI